MFSSLNHLRVDTQNLSRNKEEESASGGYGTVWFARLKTDSASVALDVAVKELRPLGNYIERSRIAIVRASTLQHPC